MQIGINTMEPQGTQLYLEVSQLVAPKYKYTQIMPNATVGTAYRMELIELKGRPHVWQAFLNGKSISSPVSLPGKFAPMVISESWDGGSHFCNGFAYRFEQVEILVKPGGKWLPLSTPTPIADKGYHYHKLTATSFLATTGS